VEGKKAINLCEALRSLPPTGGIAEGYFSVAEYFRQGTFEVSLKGELAFWAGVQK
jgi:hypothetical protein